MTLAEYLQNKSLDRHQFAERISVSSEAVRRYLAGKRIPEREIMARIAAETDGEVTANDFFGLAA